MVSSDQVFRNRVSGEMFVGQGLGRASGFRQRLKGLKRKAVAENLVVYFVTLTLGKSHMEVDSSRLHRFLMWLQKRFERHGGKLYYAWVLEYQLKRYERTGNLVRHWHVAIAVPFGWLPDVRYVENAVRHYQVVSEGLVVRTVELFKGWGFGQVLCCLARGDLQSYLGKYLEKSLEAEGRGVRMYSSSRMGWWSFPAWAFGVIAECVWSGLDVVRALIRGSDHGRELLLRVTDGREENRLVVVSPWERVCG
jgi:hypothetical protein